MPSYDNEPIEIPRGPPERWLPRRGHSNQPDETIPYETALRDLREHAKAAMTIEFTTIPLYLYAQFSIVSDNGGFGSKSRFSILGIVEQEMLHLTLAGNIMCALKGSQKLYDKAFIPVYDGNHTILYDQINVNLQPAEKPLLETFIKIETPYLQPDPNLRPEDDGIPRDLDKYHSIGQFYESFLAGLKKVTDEYPDILRNNKDEQFDGKDAFPDYLTVVQDYESAKAALTVIIDQGEGAKGSVDSHYNIFLDLYSKRDQWDCFPVPTNPTAATFKTNTYLFRLALACDATYCYLLQTIDRVWETPGDTTDNKILRQHLVRNMHAIMIDVLTPISGILTSQPIDSSDPNSSHAAPCFGFYGNDDGTPFDPQSLFEKMQNELDKAMKSRGGKSGGQKSKLEAILFSMSAVPPNPPPSS